MDFKRDYKDKEGWWYPPVMLALERWTQEDQEFKANLGCIRLYQKKENEISK